MNYYELTIGKCALAFSTLTEMPCLISWYSVELYSMTRIEHQNNNDLMI